MCGRFALHYPKSKLEQTLKITILFELEPRFNIVPTQKALILIGEDRISHMMHWRYFSKSLEKS